ncbi:MAG: AAA family ATPase [Syntrophobacteraceae bacterium]|jgi:general secretion pathway protein A
MYLDFFKFRKNPFHITPDPDFLFLSPSHQDAFTSIFYGIQQRKGFVAVTGEVGVGKTTILMSYLEGTDPKRIRTAYIFNPALSFHELLKQIVSELGIPAVDKDLPELVDSIFRYVIDEYKNDHNVLLIIDEAQNMPVETLERLLMLSNRETSQEKLLQIIIVGQLELENKLNLPELKELKDRIAVRCRIDTLRPAESLAYIEHRLMKASLFRNPVFTKKALKLIVKESNGIPRIINILCDNALITAFGYQLNPVDAKIIQEVIKDFRGGQPGVFSRWRFVLVQTLVVFSGLFVLASMALLTPKEIAPVRSEILSAKVPELPPAAEMMKELEVKPPVESVPPAEPEPSISEAQAIGNDKSVSEIVPHASVQLEIPGEAQAPTAEMVKEPEVKPPFESSPPAEPKPSIYEAHATGNDKSVSEIVPPASVQLEIPGEVQASAAENAPVPNDGDAPDQAGITAGPKSPSYQYVIHIGSFVDREKAEEMKTRLKGKGYNAVVKTLKQQVLGKVFVIQLQPVNSFSRAATLMAQLSSEIEGEPEIVKVPSR